MATWTSTKTRGVYVAHQRECPALAGGDARCRCRPSWRGRRRNPATGKPEWQQPVVKDRSEVLTWLAAGESARGYVAHRGGVKPSFEEITDKWLAGVEAGRIGRRRGRGKPYSETTIADYRRTWRNYLRPHFGPVAADNITEFEWQAWVDAMSLRNLSRSRIAGHLAVASAIYAWALVPSRRLVTRNPVRLVELPPSDEKSRLRVALAPEAAELLAVLNPADAVPYAIAMYAGLRRSEIDRLEWPDLLDEDRIGSRILVAKSKSEAGTARRPPIAEPLRGVLLRAWLRQGRPSTGRVLERSVMSGKLAATAAEAWEAAGLNPITLHECRHTYASLLMAAGYTFKELMEYMGHADLQMVNRYVKLLPQPGEDDAAERLNDYLARSKAATPA